MGRRYGWVVEGTNESCIAIEESSNAIFGYSEFGGIQGVQPMPPAGGISIVPQNYQHHGSIAVSPHTIVAPFNPLTPPMTNVAAPPMVMTAGGPQYPSHQHSPIQHSPQTGLASSYYAAAAQNDFTLYSDGSSPPQQGSPNYTTFPASTIAPYQQMYTTAGPTYQYGSSNNFMNPTTQDFLAATFPDQFNATRGGIDDDGDNHSVRVRRMPTSEVEEMWKNKDMWEGNEQKLTLQQQQQQRGELKRGMSMKEKLVEKYVPQFKPPSTRLTLTQGARKSSPSLSAAARLAATIRLTKRRGKQRRQRWIQRELKPLSPRNLHLQLLVATNPSRLNWNPKLKPKPRPIQNLHPLPPPPMKSKLKLNQLMTR